MKRRVYNYAIFFSTTLKSISFKEKYERSKIAGRTDNIKIIKGPVNLIKIKRKVQSKMLINKFKCILKVYYNFFILFFIPKKEIILFT